MNHQRAIGRHGLDHALQIRLLEGGIERQDAIVDFRINRIAEFNDERRFSSRQIAWSFVQHVEPIQTAAKGASAIPARSRRARTAFAMATAFGLSPCTQMLSMPATKRLPEIAL